MKSEPSTLRSATEDGHRLEEDAQTGASGLIPMLTHGETGSESIAATDADTENRPPSPIENSDHIADLSKMVPTPLLSASPSSLCGSLPILPIKDVPAYLETRRPLADPDDETELFVTLPAKVRASVRLIHAAIAAVTQLRGKPDHLSIHAACPLVLKAFKDLRMSKSRFRALYDIYQQKRDWTVLVNLTQAGAKWQDSDRGLPDKFLTHCAARFRQYGRSDAKRQAILSIKRQWMSGRDDDGARAETPGYGYWQDWFAKTCPGQPLPAEAPIPEGWSQSNIRRQIKAAAWTKAHAALAHQGIAAARSFLPQNRATRDGLLFLQEVQFDDVKTDFRIFDPLTGQVNDLWLLIARERSCTLLLGFGMRPAKVREDGSQEHLRAIDMKLLLGWILERYGLPPYECIWNMENNVASVSDATAAAIKQLLPGHIRCQFASMIGGKSPTGYRERAVGNSKGKAMIESLHRLGHTIASGLPGQTGPLYTVRPADLIAREREATEIWKLAQYLPEDLRGQLEYPLLDIAQARKHLFRIFGIQNTRIEHNIEGFDKILEWFDPARGLWLPQNTAPNPLPQGSQVRRRMQSPVERAETLFRPYAKNWRWPSPEIITALYETTARIVIVQPSGEVKFTIDGKDFLYRAPEGAPQPVPGAKLLAYGHPDDPATLTLTDPKGGILGTWPRSDRNRLNDPEALRLSMAYTGHALKAAKQYVAGLASQETRQLADMRARNAARMNEFVAVGDPQPQISNLKSEISSPVASGLAAIAAARSQTKKQERAAKSLAQDARSALMGGML